MAAEEEERIRDAHARIEELRARVSGYNYLFGRVFSCSRTDCCWTYEQKEALTRKRGRIPFTKTISSSRPKPTTPLKPSDSREEAFWNTPGAPGRILQFKNEGGMNDTLLTDERMDAELGDITGSFATPVPKARSKSRTRSGLGEEVLGEDEDGDDDDGNATVSPDEVINGRGGDEEEDGNDEKTVMYSKRPFLLFSLQSIPHILITSVYPPAPAHSQDSEPTSSSPTPSHVSEISIDPDAHASPPSAPTQAEGPLLTESVSTPTKLGGSGRLKIKITSDVERIVVRFFFSRPCVEIGADGRSSLPFI